MLNRGRPCAKSLFSVTRKSRLSINNTRSTLIARKSMAAEECHINSYIP